MEGSITDDASFPADVYTLTAPLVSPHAIDLPSGENAIDKMSPFERMERRIIIQNIRFRRSQAYTTMWQPTNLATLIWEVCAINIPSAITLFKHYPLPYFPRCFKICVWNVSNKNNNKIKGKGFAWHRNIRKRTSNPSAVDDMARALPCSSLFPPVSIIFSAPDTLRLRVTLWVVEGLDLHLVPKYDDHLNLVRADKRKKETCLVSRQHRW